MIAGLPSTTLKARFDTPAGRQVVPCFNHHITDFIQSARNQGLVLVDLDEHFDHQDRSGIPRILTILLKKPLLKNAGNAGIKIPVKRPL